VRQRVFIGISVFVLLAAPAMADISPPIWVNHSSVTTILDFDEAFPDYAVFRVATYRTSAPGFDPSKNRGTIISWGYSADEVTVDPANPARITGDGSRRFSLYAIPRSAIESGHDPKDLITAVNQGKVPGAARLSLDDLEKWDAPRDQSELVVRYRLERTPDGVVFIRMTADGSSTFEGNSIGRRYRWMLAGAIAAVGVAAAGLWWTRRRKKKTAVPIAPPANEP
jgi:hypothetical protein